MGLQLQMFYIKAILMTMMMTAQYLSLNNILTKPDSQDWRRGQHIATPQLTLTAAWMAGGMTGTSEIHSSRHFGGLLLLVENLNNKIINSIQMSILTYVKQDREHVLFSNTHMILNQN